MADSGGFRRWPAYAVAALFLAYAAGKAVYAARGLLGFPGGPPVSAGEEAAYFLDASVAQWLASASGVLGAGVAVATVTPRGRRAPRRPMLAALGVVLLAVLGGGGVMAVDAFAGLGVGWRWYHGLLGLAAIGLTLEMSRSYARATRRATG
ncbi:hypothetical protein [Bailinhaonella thermotolerans]|uniref:Uncharacterized protein n=1 Tax=Bailinhaonella thermotolerans TaxID=1070861 RepID=A0A3A4BT40_9ACTN|nr:hypothetical protein [Bailinhaonella thermotolerans]RJL34476.1 hypothetical protein D5H75_08645 [Bailinhaonella thermotolerans]